MILFVFLVLLAVAPIPQAGRKRTKKACPSQPQSQHTIHPRTLGRSARLDSYIPTTSENDILLYASGSSKEYVSKHAYLTFSTTKNRLSALTGVYYVKIYDHD